MHLKENIDYTDFLLSIKKCNADVYFDTSEGDSICLNSVLGQYIFASITDQTDILKNGILRFADTKDRKVLADFLLE